jgi:predicted phosphodiesterase
MKLQLISDVHLEFWKYHTKQAKYDELERNILRPADVLVLAGDLDSGRQNTIDSLKFLADHYDNVMYVPGNHEYYQGLHIRGFDYDNFDCKLPENVRHLKPESSYQIDDVTFFGATLWTNFDESLAAEKLAHKYINDFRRIPDAHKMKDIYYEHLEWIQHAYSETQGKKVIVTHFLPAMACVSPKYRDGDMVTQYLNHYFANSLDGWIATLENATWLFGHTHDAVDVTLGQTRCLARPVGYPGEHPKPYEPLVFEL